VKFHEVVQGAKTKTLIFDRTGEVRDGFHVVGSADVPVYLLDGPAPVLFDAGLAQLGRLYEEGVRAVLGKAEPGILFLTHSHFDHCGAAGYLKRVFPGLKVAAGRRAREILKRPNAIKRIRGLMENADEALVSVDRTKLLNRPFEPFEVDMILEDGQAIDLGAGTTVKVLSTPGHTWDFLSYHIPEKYILVASEAAGCATVSGRISIDCLTDFDLYLASLRRLASLETRILCQGHRFVYTDQDAAAFLKGAIKAALEFKEMVKDLRDKEGDNLPLIMSRIRAAEYDPLPFPKQPEKAYLVNLEARVRTMLAFLALEKESSP
jgi:glyoxylase-like metal-dependent hydrolase (beta-lactamase superfamily II)